MRLSEVAEKIGGQMVGSADPVITGFASIDDAQVGDLTFVVKDRYLKKLESSNAGAALIGLNMASEKPAIRVEDPYRAFALLLQDEKTDIARVFPDGVHPTAIVHETADIDPSVALGPYSVVGAGCRIGKGTRLGPLVCLGPDVVIGRDCLLYAQATVRECCRLGDRVTLHVGCCIGSDGFGLLPGPSGLEEIPQVGIVELNDDVSIGAGACIDRATTGLTSIGQGTKIDNLVQIGHNVKIGAHCTMSGLAGIAGSTTVGDQVAIGGGTSINGHIKLGDGARVGGHSGVVGEVKAGETVLGYPALPAGESLRISAAERKLPDLLRRVRELEARLEGLTADKE